MHESNTHLQMTIQSINVHMSPHTFIFNTHYVQKKKIQPMHYTGNTLVLFKSLNTQSRKHIVTINEEIV